MSLHEYENQSLHQNVETGSESLYDRMEELSAEETEGIIAEAEDIARQLIMNSNLPLLYRVRAHIILGIGQTNFFYHAREAVRICEMAIARFAEEILTANGIPGEQSLLAKARRVLRIREAEEAQTNADDAPDEIEETHEVVQFDMEEVDPTV